MPRLTRVLIRSFALLITCAVLLAAFFFKMPAGQIAGMIGSFAVLSVIGVGLMVIVLRSVSSERADSDIRYAA